MDAALLLLPGETLRFEEVASANEAQQGPAAGASRPLWWGDQIDLTYAYYLRDPG
jgi:hypothetical protein